jgi:hypothetical protein
VIDYGKEKAMWSDKRLSVSLLALVIFWLGGCGPRLLPAAPPGVTLQPGRYLAGVYVAPGFTPDKVAYKLGSFTVETAAGVAPQDFLTQLQTELARGLEANGLQAPPHGEACLLSGTVNRVGVAGGRLRFLTGKISADLVVSGTITRGDQTLFAFQDRVHLTSPVKPGAAAPRENELLLRQVARAFVIHLLNELLLQGAPPAEG